MGRSSGPAPRRPLADFHVHLFPDRFFDAIRRRFVLDYGWEVVHRLYWRECLSFLRTQGVETFVYSNYAHREGISRTLNDWNLEVLADVPDLYCFAAFHPGDRDGLAMAADLLDHPRVLGFKLHFLVQSLPPDDERLFPLYELVMERGKYILMHVGTGPVGNEFVGAAAFQRLLARYPELPVVVAHMGALEYKAFAALAKEHPRIYLDTAFAFLPRLGAQCDLGATILEELGGRILYGSDFPNIIFPLEEEIETLLALGLSRRFYEAVFQDNARRLIAEITHARP